MRWHTVNGVEYLYRAKRSLGPRGPERERIKTDYDAHRFGLQSRLETLNLRLGEMTRVNRAMGLGRVPKLSARILRKLDSAGLLGRHLFVVGTHALFAYEAAAGIFFESGLTERMSICCGTSAVDCEWPWWMQGQKV
jgi:hypothetical protein